MKTYKQQSKYYKNLCLETNKALVKSVKESDSRKLALKEAKLPDPVQVEKYFKSLDVLLNLYYTMNQARPEWELVRNLLADLGEV